MYFIIAEDTRYNPTEGPDQMKFFVVYDTKYDSYEKCKELIDNNIKRIDEILEQTGRYKYHIVKKVEE